MFLEGVLPLRSTFHDAVDGIFVLGGAVGTVDLGACLPIERGATIVFSDLGDILVVVGAALLVEVLVEVLSESGP